MPQTPQRLKDEQAALLGVLDALLSPIAELCLAKGVSIQILEESLRRALVGAATRACDAQSGDRQTSRISTMTGLTRREVSRIRSSDAPQMPESRSIAGDVLTHWVADSRFHTPDGTPCRLTRSGPAPSFEALAALVTRDVHHRTILDEMCRLGLTSHDPQRDLVTLTDEAFVPSGDWPRMVGFLGANVGDHLRAATANVLASGHEHFEQSLLADELSSQSLERAKSLISDQWQTLMREMAPALQRLMSEDQAAGRAQDQQLRVGLYSFSESMPPAKTPALKGTSDEQ